MKVLRSSLLHACRLARSQRTGLSCSSAQALHSVERTFASASSSQVPRATPDDGLTLTDFLKDPNAIDSADLQQEYPMIDPIAGVADQAPAPAKTFYIETYGCQMNISDSEIVHSVLGKAGMMQTEDMNEADVILINTCSIRDNAEQKVWSRLDKFRSIKRKKRKAGGKKAAIPTVGVLGCMAERLKEKLLETDKMVDVVAGPDAYKDLPRLLTVADQGGTAVNTMLSLDETYSDIAPVRRSTDKLSAFVSIMRGCEQYCSYCIVPFTRGKERSRPIDSIVEEVKELAKQGYKEVTLLGQNVNSYNDISSLRQEGKRRELKPDMQAKAEGFKNISRRPKDVVNFAMLLDRVAEEAPEVRFRFTSPHPKDFSDEVLHVIRDRTNVCSQIHLPFQSGSTRMLEKMRRGYSREAYLDLVEKMHSLIPNLALSTDVITGFCSETEEDHEDTVELMKTLEFDQAFMYKYSQREKTHAHRKYPDDVPEDVKARRLTEIINAFRTGIEQKNAREIGREHVVMVQGNSKRSDEDLVGTSDCYKRVIFPKVAITEGAGSRVPTAGEYVKVLIKETTSASLKGVATQFTKLQQ